MFPEVSFSSDSRYVAAFVDSEGPNGRLLALVARLSFSDRAVTFATSAEQVVWAVAYHGLVVAKSFD